LEAIEGVEPKKDLHESFFFIQPKSGLPVALAFKFQINMALQDIKHMARVEKFTDLTFPLLWFELVSIAQIFYAIDINALNMLKFLYFYEKHFY